MPSQRTLRFETTSRDDPSLAAIPSQSPPPQIIRQLARETLPTVSGAASIGDAEATLIASGHERLLVVDEAGQLLGVLCAAALLQTRLSGLDRERTAAELAGRNVLLCTPEQSPREVVGAFREARHTLAVVVDHGRPVGVLFRLDVLRWLVDEETREPVASVDTQDPAAPHRPHSAQRSHMATSRQASSSSPE